MKESEAPRVDEGDDIEHVESAEQETSSQEVAEDSADVSGETRREDD